MNVALSVEWFTVAPLPSAALPDGPGVVMVQPCGVGSGLMTGATTHQVALLSAYGVLVNENTE